MMGPVGSYPVVRLVDSCSVSGSVLARLMISTMVEAWREGEREHYTRQWHLYVGGLSLYRPLRTFSLATDPEGHSTNLSKYGSMSLI